MGETHRLRRSSPNKKESSIKEGFNSSPSKCCNLRGELIGKGEGRSLRLHAEKSLYGRIIRLDNWKCSVSEGGLKLHSGKASLDFTAEKREESSLSKKKG